MNHQRLPRREFGRCLAGGLACALPLAAAGDSSAVPCTERDLSEAAVGVAVSLCEQAAQQQSPVPLAPDEHYLALVQLLYPDERLGESELQEVRRQIQVMLGRSKVLSEFPLSNGDEPAVSFAAYRSAE